MSEMLLKRASKGTMVVVLMLAICSTLRGDSILDEQFDSPKYTCDKMLGGQAGWEDVETGEAGLAIEISDGVKVARSKNPGWAGSLYSFPTKKTDVICATVEWNMARGQLAGSRLTLRGEKGEFVYVYVCGNTNGMLLSHAPIAGAQEEFKRFSYSEDLGEVRPKAGQWIVTQLEVDLNTGVAIGRWKERSAQTWTVQGTIELQEHFSVSNVELLLVGNDRPFAKSISVSTKPGGKKDIKPKAIIKPTISIQREQDPAGNCGAKVKIENPQKEALGINYSGSVCDMFGRTLLEKNEKIIIEPNGVELFLPVEANDRVVIVHVRLTSDDGAIDEDAQEFISVEPKSLEKIDGSEHFGFCMFPYLPEEQEKRMLGLLGACGCKSVRGFEMDRCFDEASKTIVPERMRLITSKLREAGVTSITSILAYAPVWASSIPESRPEFERRFVSPDLDVWAQLVREYVKGSDFDAYEVWNEPDGGFWNSHPKADTYVLLLKKTYEVVKDVRPNAIVVGGVSNNGSTGWPESVLKKAPGYTDVISFHSYRYGNRYNEPEKGDVSFPSYISIAADLQKMSSKYNGGKPLPLWITEFGYRTPEDLNLRFDMHDQAKLLTRSFIVLAASGVQKSFNHLFEDASPADLRFGVVRIDWSIKPSWWAFRTLNQHAANKSIGPVISIGDSINASVMTGKQDVTLAVWAVEDYPSIVVLKKSPKSVKNLYGLDVEKVQIGDDFVFVIPAGSVVYINSSKLVCEDIEPLIDICPEFKETVNGETPSYSVREYKNAQKYLGKFNKKYNTQNLWYSNQYQKGYGQITVPVGKTVLDIPVSFPVTKSITATIGYDAKGDPAIAIKNGTPVDEELVIWVHTSEERNKFNVTVPSRKEVVKPLGTKFKDSSFSEQITVNVEHRLESWSLCKEIWPKLIARKIDNYSLVKNDILNASDSTKLNIWEGGSNKKPESEKDFSAKLVFDHDDDFLYIVVEVIDDIHSQPFAGKDAWQGDSLQLGFVAPQMGDKSGSEIVYYLTDDGRKGWYCFDLNLKQEGLDLDVIRRDGKTLYFISVPLTTLRIPPLETARLAVIINENDGTPAHEGYLRWADGIGSKKDSELYGVVQIEAKGK